MQMKISERLLEKIFTQFPELKTESNKGFPLRTTRGINDGCRYSWSNGCGFDDHIFSYNTMKECLSGDIRICHHLYSTGNHGYEVYVNENQN